MLSSFARAAPLAWSCCPFVVFWFCRIAMTCVILRVVEGVGVRVSVGEGESCSMLRCVGCCLSGGVSGMSSSSLGCVLVSGSLVRRSWVGGEGFRMGESGAALFTFQ
jgi:hypothetical protein